TDGDGVSDGDEVTGAKNDGKPTDPNKADTDGDGLSDGDEIKNGTDPLDPNDPGKKAAEQPKGGNPASTAQLSQTGSSIIALVITAIVLMFAGVGVLVFRKRSNK
ncbi:MAG: thrombospondin type 3 repeat-containing protein, partial [Bifidobacterium castoris]|nr:thrombospondin type 3 repeat-containing protein [Bifidobacterium castoris]